MIFLLRHGETYNNINKIYQGSKTNSPLTEKGIKESIAINRFFNTYFRAQYTVFTSPSLRCIETKNIVLNNIYNDCYISELLNEQSYGDWEGLTVKEINKKYPKEWANYINNNMGFKPPNGESLNEVINRVNVFYNNFIKKNLDQHYILITHKKVSWALRFLLFPNEFHSEHENNLFYMINILQNDIKCFSSLGEFYEPKDGNRFALGFKN